VSAERSVLSETVLAWIVALSVIGYPVAGVMSVILDVDSRVTSIPFRLLVDLLAGMAVMITIQRPKRASLPYLPLFALLWLYLLRLIWDLQRPEFEAVGTDTLFYISSALIPALAAGLLARHWNDQTVASAIFFTGSMACALVLIVDLSGFAGNRSLTAAQGRLRLDTINPITLGQAGASVMIGAAVLWSRWRTLLGRAQLLAGTGIGAWVLVLANSRSPYVGVGAALAAWLVATRRWRYLALLFVSGAVVWLSGQIAERLAGSRLVNLADRSTMERVIAQRAAVSDYLSHPLIGSGYLDSQTLFYPHNIMIEAAMALGTGGLLLITALLGMAVLHANRAFASGAVMLGCVFWQQLVLSQFSGNLFESGTLYILMMVLAVYTLDGGRSEKRGLRVTAGHSLAKPWRGKR
jgi:hypothetical protein